MNAKRALALLLLTAMLCLLASACCWDPYRHHRGGRGRGDDRRYSLNLPSPDALGSAAPGHTLLAA
jgi:hypothetical protein